MHKWENDEGFHAAFWWRVVDGELCVFDKKGGRLLQLYSIDENIGSSDCESMARGRIDNDIEWLARAATQTRVGAKVV